MAGSAPEIWTRPRLSSPIISDSQGLYAHRGNERPWGGNIWALCGQKVAAAVLITVYLLIGKLQVR